MTPGVRVKLPHDWEVEALLTYGDTHDEANSYYGTNNTALNTALASNNPATAFDPYGLHRTSQATLDLIGNQIFLAPTLGRFTGYEARVNGGLFDLPGGEVKLAAGYEGQELGVSLGSARGNPTVPIAYRKFSRRVDSVYGELLVPLVGDANHMTGIYDLDLDVAVRYDNYSDVGNTTNPKYGINWAPIEGLTIRGSYGTSFRAPQFAEIYGNSNNLFQQNYQNPAGGPTPARFSVVRCQPGAGAGNGNDLVGRRGLGSHRSPAPEPYALGRELQEPGRGAAFQPDHTVPGKPVRRHGHHPARHGGARSRAGAAGSRNPAGGCVPWRQCQQRQPVR